MSKPDSNPPLLIVATDGKQRATYLDGGRVLGVDVELLTLGAAQGDHAARQGVEAVAEAARLVEQHLVADLFPFWFCVRVICVRCMHVCMGKQGALLLHALP